MKLLALASEFCASERGDTSINWFALALWGIGLSFLAVNSVATGQWHVVGLISDQLVIAEPKQ